jgi:hypothetical protein
MTTNGNESSIVIFSDEDTDGMTSSRMVYNYYDVLFGIKPRLLYQTWDEFGWTEEDIKMIQSYKPSVVYMTDIGSSDEYLKLLEPLLKEGSKVFVYDNHPGVIPSTFASIYKTKYGDDFVLKSTRDNCTAGLVYKYLVEPAIKDDSILRTKFDKWAMIGLIGDVASKKGEGGAIFEKLLRKHPMFTGSIRFSSKTKPFFWGLGDFFAQFFHVPRRILYNEAPHVVFEAMKEMEEMKDWMAIYRVLDSELARLYPLQTTFVSETDYKIGEEQGHTITAHITLPEEFDSTPYVERLMHLNLRWRNDWKKVQDRGNNVELDYGSYGVTVISHPWNLGSALCNVRQKEKAHFVINYIPQLKKIHISGRTSSEGPISIGDIFSDLPSDVAVGGGLKEAGSAIALPGVGVETILGALKQADWKAAEKNLKANLNTPSRGSK